MLCLQVVWTSGERSILLWCAYTGAYLGALISKDVDPALEGDAEATASEREERKLFIDSSKVLVHRQTSCTCRPARQCCYSRALHFTVQSWKPDHHTSLVAQD